MRKLRKFAIPEWITTARGWTSLVGALTLVLLASGACLAGSDSDEPDINVDEILVELLGGETTAFSDGLNAFELSARNLGTEDRRTFEVGDSFFNQNWVSAPATTDARDGLGPVFNALSCSSCHSHDGRGRPPLDDDDAERGLLLRLSIPGENGPVDDPNYGGQLQDRATLGLEAEGSFRIVHEEIAGQFADGETYTLMRPTYIIENLAYGPLHPDIMVSPRVAPAMVGLGLLEAIPDDVLLALADPGDEDGDGISGRVNMVFDVRSGERVIGRFGWKAGQPTVEQQAAGAFLGDLGITSTLFPVENCTVAQADCLVAPNGGSPEIPEDRLIKIALYNRVLAVPAMRNIDDPQVRSGAELFISSGCASCHVPTFKTGDHEIEAVANQTIFPYTDLLLHDMGADLADNRPEADADGREWRTAPLWGIGLVETVNGHTRFMHDGRARNLTEAILWHGGEAAASRDVFKGLSSGDRDALIAFLRAL